MTDRPTSASIDELLHAADLETLEQRIMDIALERTSAHNGAIFLREKGLDGLAIHFHVVEDVVVNLPGVVLRRRTEQEFPDRVTTLSAAGMAQTMAEQTRDSISRRVRARTERREGEAATSRVEALERIGRLRDSGVLTEDEFRAEKSRLLAATAVEESIEAEEEQTQQADTNQGST